MEIALNVVRDACLIAGVLFILAGNVGILRFPDFYTRVHAAGITDTAGTLLVLVGLIVEAGFTLPSIKLVLIFLFMYLANPTSSHALAKAAVHGGLKPYLGSEGRS